MRQRAVGARAIGWMMIGAAVALGACHATIYDAVDPVVHVVTPTVWTGSAMVLTCDALVGPDTLPLVLIGADTVAATFVAPDTLRVAAPVSPGSYAVSLVLHGRSPVPVGTVRVAGGYAEFRDVPLVGGFPLQWPGGALPTFLIALPAGLARVDPRSGANAALLPDSLFSAYCIDGPGPAPDGRIVVQGRVGANGCGPLVSLRPDTPWLAPDTGPAMSSGFRFAARLGPTRWLAAFHHGVYSFSRDTSGTWQVVDNYWGELDEPQGIAVSPRGDRAVVRSLYHGVRGLPVFTPESPEPAYWLPQFRDLLAAQFSDDGDTIFVVADTGAGQTQVLAALRASDGAMLRSAAVPSYAYDLVLDPGRPWLYVITWPDDALAVVVVDRGTLATVTTLLAPPCGGSPVCQNVPYAMLAATERRLYLPLTCSFCVPGYSTRVVAFDLIP